MSVLQAVILGIVQGLTEFIPVSSTAHLILVESLMGLNLEADAVLAFNVLIQLGTALAVILYFWSDWWAIARALAGGLAARQPWRDADSRLGWLLVVATIPGAVLGLLLKKPVEQLHQNAAWVAVILMAAALLLFAAERVGARARSLTTLKWLDALLIGSAQAIAVIPGVSRSAATISMGLVRNFERPAAARFSFLMSAPILLAAGLYEARDLLKLPNLNAYLAPLAVGFVVAAVVGFLAIRWLLAYLSTRSLNAFGWYRIAAGAFFLVVVFLSGR